MISRTSSRRCIGTAVLRRGSATPRTSDSGRSREARRPISTGSSKFTPAPCPSRRNYLIDYPPDRGIEPIGAPGLRVRANFSGVIRIRVEGLYCRSQRGYVLSLEQLSRSTRDDGLDGAAARVGDDRAATGHDLN